jgi:uncharacterized protein (DUF983 family)
MRDPSAGLTTMVGRALTKKCSRCGGGAIFRTFGELHERCNTCGFKFEREPGYWVGAMIINTTVTFASILVVFVLGMVLTWPDVPWTVLLVVTVLVAGVVPVIWYPLSKTVWQAIELSYHQLEDHEILSAMQYLDDRAG